MSTNLRISRLIAVATLAVCALACTEAVDPSTEAETASLHYATAAGAAGSAGFTSRRTATIHTETPRAADELVAQLHDPARPGTFATPQHTQQVNVSWSCDDGHGGKNSGSCDVTGLISAKACINTIKAKCPKKTVTVSW